MANQISERDFKIIVQHRGNRIVFGKFFSFAASLKDTCQKLTASIDAPSEHFCTILKTKTVRK